MAKRLIASGPAQIMTESFGAPSDPPVLAIMGATASMLWWPEPLLEGLAAAGRFVVRFDNRDTGESTCYPPGKPPYSFDDMADDALAVLDAYGLARADVMGLSMGGLLGQILAVRDPARVRTLTAIAAPYFGRMADPQPQISPQVLAGVGRRDAVDWADNRAVEDYVAELWRINGGPVRPFEDDRVRGVIRRDLARCPSPRSMFNHTGLSGGVVCFDRARQIAAPVLAIQGDADPVVPERHARELTAAVPNGRLVILPGAGHDLHSQDQPVILREVLAHTA